MCYIDLSCFFQLLWQQLVLPMALMDELWMKKLCRKRHNQKNKGLALSSQPLLAVQLVQNTSGLLHATRTASRGLRTRLMVTSFLSKESFATGIKIKMEPTILSFESVNWELEKEMNNWVFTNWSRLLLEVSCEYHLKNYNNGAYTNSKVKLAAKPQTQAFCPMFHCATFSPKLRDETQNRKLGLPTANELHTLTGLGSSFICNNREIKDSNQPFSPWRIYLGIPEIGIL